MSQVFKITHSGAEAPEMVSVGVRVREESGRDTLEVPVVYTWQQPGKPLSENRTYTFSRWMERIEGRSRLRQRATRFVEVPVQVAELLASVEFHARDAENRELRGHWLDVRVAANQDEYDKADSMAPSLALKAETAPEPPGLLRPKKVTRTGPPAAPARHAPAGAETSEPAEGDLVVEDDIARGKQLDKQTKAQLLSYAGKVLRLELGERQTKAEIISAILAAESGTSGAETSEPAEDGAGEE